MVRCPFTIISLLCTCHATTLKPPPYFSIGGLFDTFAVENSSLAYVRQDAGSQYLAAFVMAVDEINNKADGIHDDLLPKTKIRLICQIGVSILALYPPNNFVYGAGRAYELRLKDSSLVATVDGSSNDDSTSATAQTLNNWGVLSLISRSTSADYAHSDSFPLTLQNTPSQTSEAFSLVHLTNRFNWENVAVFFIYDTKVGLDATVAYQSALPFFGINLLGSYPIKTGQTNFDLPISQALATGATIFAFFLDGNAAGQLLEQGYNAGLFHDGTQVLATSTSKFKDIRAALTPAGLLNEARILKGFITTAPHPEYYFSTPQGQAFISRFRNLPPTITYDPVTNQQVCDKRTDASPNLDPHMYQTHQFDRKKDNKTLCLGIKSFQKYHQNGSNIDPYTMYVYDAVYSLVYALDVLLKDNSTTPAVNPFSIEDMKEGHRHRAVEGTGELGGGVEEELDIFALLAARYKNISATEIHNLMTSQSMLYPGMVTGSTAFMGLGGTRNTGNVFKMLNYHNTDSGKGDGTTTSGLGHVGDFTDATGWLICDEEADEAKMPPFCRILCTTPEYRNTPSSKPPSDTLPDIIEELPYAYRIPLMSFAALGLLLLLFHLAYVVTHWNEKAIKRSQPVLHLIIFVGSFCGLVKVFLSTAPVNRSNCVAQLWLEHLCYRLVLRTLLLKLWRVHVIVNASVNSVRRVIGLKTVLSYIVVDILILIFLLSAITYTTSTEYNNSVGLGSMDKNHLMNTETNVKNNQMTIREFCSAPKMMTVAFVFNTTLFSFEALYLLLFAYYIYITRDLPSTIRAAGAAGKGTR